MWLKDDIMWPGSAPPSVFSLTLICSATTTGARRGHSCVWQLDKHENIHQGRKLPLCNFLSVVFGGRPPSRGAHPGPRSRCGRAEFRAGAGRSGPARPGKTREFKKYKTSFSSLLFPDCCFYRGPRHTLAAHVGPGGLFRLSQAWTASVEEAAQTMFWSLKSFPQAETPDVTADKGEPRIKRSRVGRRNLRTSGSVVWHQSQMWVMFWICGAEPAAAIIIIITVGHKSRDEVALLTKITQHEGWNDAVQVQTTQTDPMNKLQQRQTVLSPHVYFILLKKLHLNAPQRLQATDVLQEKKQFRLFWCLMKSPEYFWWRRKTRRSFSRWIQWQRLLLFYSGADSACRTDPQASSMGRPVWAQND